MKGEGHGKSDRMIEKERERGKERKRGKEKISIAAYINLMFQGLLCNK